MKIGFDARMITHPGIGRYIQCLLPEIIRQAPQDEFVLFGDPERLKDMLVAGNVRVIKWNAPVYSLQEQLFIPHGVEKVDLMHVPHFNIPLYRSVKMVVTVHDLIYLLFPRSVPSPAARYYARFMIGNVLKKSRKVIAVSRHTRDDLLKIFGNRWAGNIKVIYEAAGKNFRKVEDTHVLERTRRKYGLAKNIILYVGSIKPHKNIGTLVKVYDKLRERGVPHQLVIAGKWDRKENYLRKNISREEIKYIGEVPAEDLATLYSLADVLVHLSLYEGFGLTVLESMQCGTPVVVSNTSSLPEIAGPGVLTVSPLNIGQIADTVYNVLINEGLRKAVVEAGFRQSLHFSWEKAASETLEIYHKV